MMLRRVEPKTSNKKPSGRFAPHFFNKKKHQKKERRQIVFLNIYLLPYPIVVQ